MRAPAGTRAALAAALLLQACAAPEGYIGAEHGKRPGGGSETRGVAGVRGDGPTVTNSRPESADGEPAPPSRTTIYYDINVEIR
jgi:hypothetical protein